MKSLKEGGQTLALKKIMISLNGTQMTEQRRLRVMRETEIMGAIEHPHIVKMHAHFIDCETEVRVKDPEKKKPTKDVIEKWFLCIVMEHASNGDLLHLI